MSAPKRTNHKNATETMGIRRSRGTGWHYWEAVFNAINEISSYNNGRPTAVIFQTIYFTVGVPYSKLYESIGSNSLMRTTVTAITNAILQFGFRIYPDDHGTKAGCARPPCPHGNRKQTLMRSNPAPTKSASCRFASRNRPFCIAKRPVSHPKTCRFEERNGASRNALIARQLRKMRQNGGI